MGMRVKMVFAVILISVLALTSCNADEQVQAKSAGRGRRRRCRSQRRGRKRPGGHARGGGDDGTRFSGVCSVGRQAKVIGGRVPVRYVFHPGGSKLECELRKEGSAALEIVLAAGSNVRSVQRTDAQKSTINVAYSSGGLSSSVFSSSG